MNNIKQTIRMSVTNGNFKDEVNPSQLILDQQAQGYHAQIANVGTSEEDMPTGDVGTEGFLFLRNLDGTNYVSWGASDGTNMHPIGRVNAGEVALFRMEPGSTLRWVADTAAVDVEYRLYEN